MLKNNIKVLIVSRGVWRDDNNSGNTLTNLFANFDSNNIANIYCSPQYPDNKVCKKYFQINDRMLINNIIKPRQTVGKVFDITTDGAEKNSEKLVLKEKNIYDFLRMHRLTIFYTIREAIWKTGRWKNHKLDKFIEGFDPDIIFAPLYDSHYMNRLDRYIKEKTRKKMVTFITDDLYTYKQFSLSPFFWINRFFLRRNIRKTIKVNNEVYIMAPKQKEEYDQIFNINSKILYKGGNFNIFSHKKKQVNSPIKLVFAGNVFSGRWKSLAKIGEAIKKINEYNVKAQLYIYTQNPISKKMRTALDIPKSVFLMGGISYSEIKKILLGADIVVHVESLELKYKLLTRLSFSTKLVDYFESGRCIFAVGWREASSIDYLIKNDAAIVVGDLKNIEVSLRKLIDNPQLILDYGRKAWECGKRNHQIEVIRGNLYKDLYSLCYE